MRPRDDPEREGSGDLTEADGLRDAFARLRAADRAAAPSYDAMAAPRPMALAARRRRLIPGLAAAAAATLLVGYALYASNHAATSFPRRGVASDARELPVAWRSPTDFLLDVPGTELLRTTPRFASAVGWSAMNLREWRTAP